MLNKTFVDDKDVTINFHELKATTEDNSHSGHHRGRDL